MTTHTKTHASPDALNALVEDIALMLFDQTQDTFEDREGKPIKISRLDAIKLRTAKKLAATALRFGNPHERFERFSNLSNEYLPKLLDLVGENTVIAQLEKLPEDKRTGTAIDMLGEAGATGIADLLRKAWQGTAPAEIRVPENVQTDIPTAAAEDTVAGDVPEALEADAAFSDQDVSEDTNPGEERDDFDSPEEDPVRILEAHLKILKTLHRQVGTAVADLQASLTALKNASEKTVSRPEERLFHRPFNH